ncbi:MAG: CDP-diacylglycerol--glycerol-3-phosphate 3-phosphatidyltransferase [Deltaproteobacteria bacterium]|nr:CDP-diacylglycerol--glycerol-3-phosphate 3-phosphatidyltransferase [Deltaproteobacteria bacterium]
MMKSIPNYLTYLRLVLIPIFVFLMVNPSDEMLYAATVIFVIAAITDYLDGLIARNLDAVTELGKLLDPLADKILVISALVMLVAQRSDVDGAPWVPGWMVALILAREVWVTGLRGIAANRGVVIAASSGGKVKSALQLIAISCLLLHYPIDVLGFNIDFSMVGMNLLILSVAFSLWSAGEYTSEVFSKNP